MKPRRSRFYTWSHDDAGNPVPVATALGLELLSRYPAERTEALGLRWKISHTAIWNALKVLGAKVEGRGRPEGYRRKA